MRALTLAAITALGACDTTPPPARPAPPPPESQPELLETRVRAAVEARAKGLVAETKIPGISIGYVLPGGRAGAVAAGVSDVETNAAMTTDDRMLLGSVGKTYVAAVVLQLVAEGALDLDAPISRWLGDRPWLARVPNGPTLTLRHLMMHRTGIPRHILTRGFIAAVRADPDRVWKPDELVSYVLDAKPKFAAGEGFAYADTNYILAGMIVEKVTGRTYYGELRRRVLEPLELARTEPSTRRDLDGLIPGYSSLARLFGRAPRVEIHGVALSRVVTEGRYFLNPQLEWTGGGLITTPGELARWGARLYGGDVLDADLRALMIAGEPSPELGGAYGIGVHVADGGPLGRSLGHEGVMPGYVTTVRYFPAADLAVAVQINTDERSLLGHPMDWFLDQIAAAIAPAIPQ